MRHVHLPARMTGDTGFAGYLRKIRCCICVISRRMAKSALMHAKLMWRLDSAVSIGCKDSQKTKKPSEIIEFFDQLSFSRCNPCQHS
jgi:hypothetical protein